MRHVLGWLVAAGILVGPATLSKAQVIVSGPLHQRWYAPAVVAPPAYQTTTYYTPGIPSTTYYSSAYGAPFSGVTTTTALPTPAVTYTSPGYSVTTYSAPVLVPYRRFGLRGRFAPVVVW